MRPWTSCSCASRGTTWTRSGARWRGGCDPTPSTSPFKTAWTTSSGSRARSVGPSGRWSWEASRTLSRPKSGRASSTSRQGPSALRLVRHVCPSRPRSVRGHVGFHRRRRAALRHGRNDTLARASRAGPGRRALTAVESAAGLGARDEGVRHPSAPRGQYQRGAVGKVWVHHRLCRLYGGDAPRD